MCKKMKDQSEKHYINLSFASNTNYGMFPSLFSENKMVNRDHLNKICFSTHHWYEIAQFISYKTLSTILQFQDWPVVL